MFLALRELAFARGRFALMGSVIALLAVLTVLLSGLATGLVDDGISGLRALPVTHLGFQEGSDSTFSRSVVDEASLDEVNATEGAEAELFGLTLVNATIDGATRVDIALMGLAPDGFVAESVYGSASPPGPPPSGGAVVSEGLLNDGVEVGDVLAIDRTDVRLEVVGVAPDATYGHVDVVYVSLADWQAVAHIGNPGDASSASALAIRATDERAIEPAAAASNLDIVTRTEAYQGSPGFSAETSTMSLIQWFLYLISAMILGAFFTIWTIQRRPEIGLQKALGASTTSVLFGSLTQVLIVLVVAVATGSVVGWLLGTLIQGGEVPFSLDPGTTLSAACILIAAGAIGMLVGIRRITTVDPIIALGAAS